MAALSDRKLELFAQALLRNIARGLARGKAATEAGYRGSAMADNARKRANRKDVKARMIELAAPAQARAEAEVAVDVAKANCRLSEIIMANVAWDETVLPKDVINAVRLVRHRRLECTDNHQREQACPYRLEHRRTGRLRP